LALEAVELIELRVELMELTVELMELRVELTEPRVLDMLDSVPLMELRSEPIRAQVAAYGAQAARHA